MAQTTEIDLGTLIDWVNEADNATINSRANSEKSRDYYDSKQWTDAEIRELKKRKQAAVVVNRVKPKIDGLAGMERSNRTTAKAFPRTPKEEGASIAATEAVRFVLDDNFYNQVRSAAWDNLTVEGTCGVEVMVKPKGDGFKIYINHLMWDRLFYDPHARRKDFRDARYKGQMIWLDYDIALERFPDGADVLETMMVGSSTYEDRPQWTSWMDLKRRRVKIVELYYQWQGDIWYACFTRGGYLKEPKVSPYKNEEGETEDPYEFASLFVDRDGNRYGAAWQYLDVQDEINKRRSKALHLMSVRQVRWERGAVEDINKARQELAKPDGVLETTPGMEFEVLKTGDMAQAQFHLLEEAKMEIDAVGYSAAASGKETRNMSGVALRNREAASQTELAPIFDVLKHLDIRIYRKVWNRIKQYWREEMWIRVTDDEGALKFVGLNKPITKMQQALQQAQSQGVPPQALQALQQQLAQDPTSQQIVDTHNDIAELDVDIVMDDAPDSVTMQQEEFTALGEMVKSGIPIPPTAIVQASNLKDKDKILQEMRQGQQMPPQVQEQLKKMQEDAQKLQQENQALKTDQQTEVAKLQAKSAADMQAVAQKRELATAEFQFESWKQQEELRLQRERAEAEVALEIWKAQQMQELEARKIAATADGEIDGAIAKVQNLATVHLTKMQGMHSAQTEAKNAKVAGDSNAVMQSMHKEFISGVQDILKTLTAKKKVSMTLPDGRKASAEVVQ